MVRLYLPESGKPKKDDVAEEAEPVTGRVYLPPSQSPHAAAKAAKVAAKAEAKAKVDAEAEAAARAAAVVEPPPDPAPVPEDPKPEDEPAGNASRDVWAEYARTSMGAGDADLVDEDGNDLGRDALREKYGTPPE